MVSGVEFLRLVLPSMKDELSLPALDEAGACPV